MSAETRIIRKSWPYMKNIFVQSFTRNMASNQNDEKADNMKNLSPSSTETKPESTLAEEKSASKTSSTTNDNTDLNKVISNNVQEISTEPAVKKQSIYTIDDVRQQRDRYLSMDLESKRALYMRNYIRIENIKTWPEYYVQEVKYKMEWVPSSKGKYREVREDLNKQISLFRGDITSLEIDAIVNAANESLLGGGGVDGAIHIAAGTYLKAECRTLYGCDTGDAKITCGYNLPAKYVIHTVGPKGEKPKLLSQCYKRCLQLVQENQLTSIAFPCVSTGIYGYPNVNAAKIVLNAVRNWMETEEYAKKMKRIIFCLFMKVDVDVYKKQMPFYFPVEPMTDDSSSSHRCSVL